MEESGGFEGWELRERGEKGQGAGRSFWDWESDIWDRDLECLHFDFLIEMKAWDIDRAAQHRTGIA